MFYGYCFPKSNGWHTPKLELSTADECFQYCKLHHLLFEEIVITDESDFCVMHVKKHILKVPFPENEFKYFDLLKFVEVEEKEFENE